MSWDDLVTQLPSGPTGALGAHLDLVLEKKEELVRDMIIRINNSSHTHTRTRAGHGPTRERVQGQYGLRGVAVKGYQLERREKAVF